LITFRSGYFLLDGPRTSRFLYLPGDDPRTQAVGAGFPRTDKNWRVCADKDALADNNGKSKEMHGVC
jgi:hypothetical protein